MHGVEKSDPPVVAANPANKAAVAAAEPGERRGGAEENADPQSTVRTQSRAAVSQARARIRGAITRNRKEKLTALLHHVDVDVLRAGFLSLRRAAAPGVDGMTWERYAEDLEANLADLHARVHAGAYRALPSRRRYIPKADGRQRPLGIAALEDKIVQAAVVMLLTPVFEAEFLGFSYGFRPGRGPHDARDALAAGIARKRISWVLDADIRSFFDTISHDWLVRFVEHRIGDRRIIRLLRKWLQAGVLEDGRVIETVAGTPQGASATPPTTLQSSFAARVRGSRVGGGRSDPEDDVDAVAVDLDALDQGPDQVALERPVDLGHPSPHPLREVLEPADDQRQGRPQGGLVPQGRGPLFPARDPLPEAGDARLELGLVDQAFGVAVDEPRRGAAQLRDLGLDLAELRTAAPAPPRLLKAPLVLGRDRGRPPQQPLALAPDRLVEPVGAHLRVRAHPLAAEAVGVAAAAAVVGVGAPLALRGRRADRLAVVGVPALPADEQALQQVVLATGALPVAPPVLLELLPGGLEQPALDQRRNRHAEPFGRRHVVDPVGAAGLLAAAPHRPQPDRPRPDPGLAEGGRPGVGGVPENAPHRRPVPGALAAPGRVALRLQAPADLADADAVTADPAEDQADDRGLLLVDLVARAPAAVPLADVAVAVGRPRQDADRALARRVPLAASAALEDLGPLVLGHHALDLEQQVVLRREADRPVEEDDLDPGAAQLVDQEDLVGVAARQPVGRVDVDTIERAGGGRVAQALEGRADERGPAVALVDEAVLGRDAQPIPRQARVEGGELARDGLVGRLLVGRYAGVDGGVRWLHVYRPLTDVAWRDGASRGSPPPDRGAMRPSRTGSRRSKASAMLCLPSRVTSWLTRTSRSGALRGLGGSTSRFPLTERPARRQRCAPEPVAVLRPQPLASDRHRGIEREFGKVVGGVVSPILANIYLHELDLLMHKWV